MIYEAMMEYFAELRNNCRIKDIITMSFVDNPECKFPCSITFSTELPHYEHDNLKSEIAKNTGIPIENIRVGPPPSRDGSVDLTT